MGVRLTKSGGFAAMEGLLVLVIVAAIVGVGYYVIHQKHSAQKTLSNSNSAPANAPAGTTASVDQQATNSATQEAGLDNSADSAYQQDAGSANGAVSNVGGAYNEASY